MQTEKIYTDHLQAYFSDQGYEGDHTIPLIMVKAYKKSGKWYATKITPLEGDLLELVNNSQSFVVTDLIKANNLHVRGFSPLINGFSNLQDYYFQIEVYNTNGFMDSIITR